MSKEEVNEKLFQKNLELWAKTCPKMALMLPYFQAKHLSLCTTKKGEANLKSIHGSLHAQSGAAVEAAAWFSGLPKEGIPLVCIYGVGLGYYYDAISPWLKEDKSRHVVFLEDDPGVIQKLLNTERGTHILQDPQVQLLYFEKVTPDEAMFEGLYWNFAMRRLIVTSLESYAKKKTKTLEELRHKIAFDAAMKNALVDEYMRYGANYYINLYKNILCLPESYYGNNFFGKFHNVPAIICGAGPSLAKNISIVHSLLDKAVVFAGGSALNVLNSAGFHPHFGAGIDPNPAQYTRMSMNKAYEVPFFYRNRMYHDAFKMIHGPRLYITGSGGYDTAEYFEEKLGIKGEDLDEGHNVVNFCVEIANAMGCNPIIFAGMDLAFTGMKEYAPGVVANPTIKQSAILEVEEEDSRAIQKDDIFGKPTYTLWKWIAESEWIGEYSKSHPQLTMINCTEGGLGFPGIPNRPFKEVHDELLLRSFDIHNRIHGEIQNSHMPKVTYPKVVKAMKSLSQSLKKAGDDISILIDDAHVSIKALKAGREFPMQSGLAALAETELLEEPAYNSVLAVFNEVYAHILSGEVHKIQVSRQTSRQRQIKKIELGISKFKFLADVAKVNEELIALAFRERLKKTKGKKVVVGMPKTISGTYKISKDRLLIDDPELNLHIDLPFDPARIPNSPKDGKKMRSGHTVRMFYDKAWKLSEAYLEKVGRQDGQSLLYYPNGKVKEESFYKDGKLHGPCCFWSPKEKLLAECWYIDGKLEGKSYWYYPSGQLYSIQRFSKGQAKGLQEYYYENGAVKTLVTYEKGDVTGEPILLLSNGKPARSESGVQSRGE